MNDKLLDKKMALLPLERLWLSMTHEDSPRSYLCFNCTLTFKLQEDRLLNTATEICAKYELGDIDISDGHARIYQKAGFAAAPIFIDEKTATYSKIEQIIAKRWQSYKASLAYPVFDFIALRTQDYDAMIFIFHHIYFDGFAATQFIHVFWELYFNHRVSHHGINYAQYKTLLQQNYQSTSYKNLYQQACTYYASHTYKTHFPRVNLQENGAHYGFYVLYNPLENKMRAYCRTQKISLFYFFLAIYELWQAIFSNTQDINYKTAIIGRHQRLLLNSLGCFANSIAISDTINFDDCFSSYLQKVQASYQQSMQFKDVAYSQIENKVQELKNIQCFFNYIPTRTVYKKHKPLYLLEPTPNYLQQLSGDNIKSSIIILESHTDCLAINLKFDRHYFSAEQATTAITLFNDLIYYTVNQTDANISLKKMLQACSLSCPS